MPSPPFTRPPVTDITSAAAAISDIYDKLSAIVQAQPTAQAAPAAAAAMPANAIRLVTRSTTLQPNDQTVSFNVPVLSSCLLPPTRNVIGLGPYIIENQSTSAASVSLQSAAAENVNGAAASTYTLAAGKSMTLQPNPGFWVIVNRIP